ncbi:DUF4173 domain-containing protein [Aequorivita sinensis]|uniref:DUF4153 domain-containing protein n=1 Tax=Aequorivita sinensis TaxID=1382458 RepID=UPI002300B21C|nr:DUF4173 domain-containing protein [Aequorivita sinensis]
MWVKNLLPVTFLSAILFSILFYNQDLGLNLIIFETSFIIFWIFTKQFNFSNQVQVITTVGFLLTSVFTVLTHSVLSYVIHFIAAFIFVGVLNYPSAKSIITVALISIKSIFQAQNEFLNSVTKSKVKGKSIGKIIWKFRIFIIPAAVIFVFVSIYKASNPIFDELTINLGVKFQSVFNFIFKDIEFLFIITLLLGLLISNILYFRTKNFSIKKADTNASDILIRKKQKGQRNFKTLSLKNELKAALFLLFILNLILLILNIADVYLVWFNFEWDGQTLKQFVHEGTYLLIFSILISIAIILYFFRGNMNFYAKNRVLKNLSYLWLFQNVILAISVGVRNYWYIEHFSLAYKRIGVAIFLILTLYGLYSVFIKIRNVKSGFYLFRTNAMALYILLVISSMVNWDGLIAKYNFAHADTAFLHFDYLVDLSDKSLPYLDKPISELNKIENIQTKIFPYDAGFMNAEEYHKRIESKKRIFKQDWESKSFLSWNFPEYVAYNKLFKK